MEITILIGKSPINGPFSIAILYYQRVNFHFPSVFLWIFLWMFPLSCGFFMVLLWIFKRFKHCSLMPIRLQALRQELQASLRQEVQICDATAFGPRGIMGDAMEGEDGKGKRPIYR